MSDALNELERFLRTLPINYDMQRQLSCRIGDALEQRCEEIKISQEEMILNQKDLTLRQKAVLAAVSVMNAPTVYTSEKETRERVRDWRQTLGIVADAIMVELLKPLPKKDEPQM